MGRKTERRESRLAFSSLLITTFDLPFLNEYLKLCSGMTVKVYLNDIILSKFGDHGKHFFTVNNWSRGFPQDKYIGLFLRFSS